MRRDGDCAAARCRLTSAERSGSAIAEPVAGEDIDSTSERSAPGMRIAATKPCGMVYRVPFSSKRGRYVRNHTSRRTYSPVGRSFPHLALQSRMGLCADGYARPARRHRHSARSVWPNIAAFAALYLALRAREPAARSKRLPIHTSPDHHPLRLIRTGLLGKIEKTRGDFIDIGFLAPLHQQL